MQLTCRGCGTEVDALGSSPWACPRSGLGDDIDHVLVLAATGAVGRIDESSRQPFIRYRTRLGSYRAALEVGWSDEQFVDLVASLDDSVAAVWGTGFAVTATTVENALGSAIGLDGALLVKDETANVSGSHKARHLFGLALWMKVRGDVSQSLAISSCGNAAMGAAVIAAALGRPLEVFVPEWADESVVARLDQLDATVVRCQRMPDEAGDPCVLRFREAVAVGALPFGCQGPDNGLTIDGGRTIGWELDEQAPGLASVYVQLGGGALASSLIAGLAGAGSSAAVTAVQTEGCAPFDRAWNRVQQVGLDDAVHHRSAAMWPWESEPVSAASGILDDETYDWAGVAAGLAASGGHSVVALESSVLAAHELVHLHTSIDADPTGTSGLAGLLADVDAGRAPSVPVAVLFTGVTRR